MFFMAVKWIPKRLVELSLINVASRTGQLFVNTCETEYAARIDAATDAVLQSGRHLVMLTGPSGSGKTTTSHKIAENLQAKGVVAQVISLDDFFLDPDRYPRLPDGSKDYENVTALDIPLINTCLAEVVATGSTMLPQFDFLTEHRRAEYKPLSIGSGVLIVEGIHAHNPCLTNALPQDKVFKIYAGLREEYALAGQRVLPTRDVRLARRMVRDNRTRGHSPVKTLQMWPGVLEGEDKYIRIFKPFADYVLDTSFSYEIQCLAPQVQAMAAQYCDGTPATQQLEKLAQVFALCDAPLEQWLPQNSMLREFLG